MFWYVGLIPDAAAMRDRVKNKIGKYFYAVFCLGWRGSARQWANYEFCYLMLAGIATLLVITTCTVVSSDFSTSVIPGWHGTIFIPYFGVGAIYGGFCMLIILLVPIRQFYKLQDIITLRHIDMCCRFTLLMAPVRHLHLRDGILHRLLRRQPERVLHLLLRPHPRPLLADLVRDDLLQLRRRAAFLDQERCGAIRGWPSASCSSPASACGWSATSSSSVSVTRDYLPSSWGMFYPTWVDVITFTGTFGVFFLLYLLFIRFLPVIAISEVRGVLPEANPHHAPVASRTMRRTRTPTHGGSTMAKPPRRARSAAGAAAARSSTPSPAEFAGPAELYHAAEKMRDQGFQLVGLLHALLRPRPRQGDGPAQVVGAVLHARGRPGRAGRRVPARRHHLGLRLPDGHAGQALLQPARLRADPRPAHDPALGHRVHHRHDHALPACRGCIIRSGNGTLFTRATHDKFFIVIEANDPEVQRKGHDRPAARDRRHEPHLHRRRGMKLRYF